MIYFPRRIFYWMLVMFPVGTVGYELFTQRYAWNLAFVSIFDQLSVLLLVLLFSRSYQRTHPISDTHSMEDY